MIRLPLNIYFIYGGPVIHVFFIPHLENIVKKKIYFFFIGTLKIILSKKNKKVLDIFFQWVYRLGMENKMKNKGIEQLKQIARKKGLKQRHICKIVGVSESCLSLWFNRRRVKLSNEHALKVAKAFRQIPLNDLHKLVPVEERPTRDDSLFYINREQME